MFSLLIYGLINTDENYYLRKIPYKQSIDIIEKYPELKSPDHDYVFIPKQISFTQSSKNKMSDETLNKWKEINPAFDIKIYSDKDCEDYLEEHFSKNHKKIFKDIIHGPIKSDYFKVHKLLEGGVFIDSDYKPFNIWKICDYKQVIIPKYKHFYKPDIIAINKDNELIKQAIAVYDELSKNTHTYGYFNWKLMFIISILNNSNSKKLKNVLNSVKKNDIHVISDYKTNRKITNN